MKTIWKFALQITSAQSVFIPEGGQILTAQMQGDTLCLWAKVDPQAYPERREIVLIGTGHPCIGHDLIYISTVQPGWSGMSSRRRNERQFHSHFHFLLAPCFAMNDNTAVMSLSPGTSGSPYPWSVLYTSPGGRVDRARFADREGCEYFIRLAGPNQPVAIYHEATDAMEVLRGTEAEARQLLAFVLSGAGAPTFRSEDTYSAPDRTAWEERHGFAPEPLSTSPRFLSRAKAATRRDRETIEFTGAVNAHTALEEIAEAVHAEAGLPESTLVFYDPDTESFWAYPTA